MLHNKSTILLLIVLLSCVSVRAQYMPDLYPYNPHASSYTHDTIDYQYTRYKGRPVIFLSWFDFAINYNNYSYQPWIPNEKYIHPQSPYTLQDVYNEDTLDVYGVAIAAYALPNPVSGIAPHETTLMLEWNDKSGVTHMDSGVFSFFSPCTNSIFRYEAIQTPTGAPVDPTDVRDTMYLPVFEVYFDTVLAVVGDFRIGSWLPRENGTILIGWQNRYPSLIPQDDVPNCVYGENPISLVTANVGWRSIFAITGPDVPVAYAPRRLWLEGTDAAGWSPQCGVEGYELETARVSGVVDTLEWPVALDFVTDTAAPLPPMSADSVYRLRVRSVVHHTCPHHDTVVRSPWSEPLFVRGGHDIGIGRVCDAGAPLSASPNPASDRLDVRCAPGSSLALRDSQGRTRLRASAPDGCASLRLDGLPSGLYLLTATAPSATATIKVLKR